MEGCDDCTYRMPRTKAMDKVEALRHNMTCLGFYPDPIPDEILTGRVGHDIPLPGQPNELVFRPLSTMVKK